MSFQTIKSKINRIGKQFEQQIGKPMEKAVQDFRDDTLIPALKNVKRFLKKL